MKYGNIFKIGIFLLIVVGWNRFRSSLNVVFAGLDILRPMIAQGPSSSYSGRLCNNQTDALELLDDIVAANETAIATLNDLLLYENIEAGGFVHYLLPTL